MVNFIGVVSIVCLLIAGIMLLIMIQRAFDREGFKWGFISIFYPPGTYLFAKKNWDIYGSQFMIISGLLISSLVLWVIIKLVA